MIDSDSCVVSKSVADALTESTGRMMFVRVDTQVLLHVLRGAVTKLVHLECERVFASCLGVDLVNIVLVVNEDSNSTLELTVFCHVSLELANEVVVVADRLAADFGSEQLS